MDILNPLSYKYILIMAKISSVTMYCAWFARLLLTILSFIAGLRIRMLQSNSIEKPCPTNFPRSVEVFDALSEAELSLLPRCNHTKVYDHCNSDPSADQTFFHFKGPDKGVAVELFPFLHHPSTPAKYSIIINQQSSWIEKDAFGSNCNKIYMTRTGSRASQPNKCVAVTRLPEGVASIVQHSHRNGYTALLTNQYSNDYSRSSSFPEESVLLLPLLRELPALRKDFLQKMGSPIDANGGRRTAIVMVANEGVIDLLLNFICSAEQAEVEISNVVVFVGTVSIMELIENMGAKAIYSPALGSMPRHAAEGYLDNTFARMMWFKTTSVFLALEAGFDVLFQDVDLVWLQDPLPFLRQQNADILFMDDGARTPRYTPFYVNSGFYFMKHNERTSFFMERMMKSSVSEIGTTHSHQSVLIRHLAESVHLNGLKVLVLGADLFPSGQAYHENKPYIKKIIAHTFKPMVFHMCWTSNRVDKVIYFKEIGLWYLPEKAACTKSQLLLSEAIEHKAKRTGRSVRDSCCERSKYWK